MTYTLAAVFEHRTDANYARDALISAGFDSHTIQLSDAAGATGAARQQDIDTSPGATDESLLDSVKHFFGRLFGTEHDDQRMIAEAIRRGHVVLTVHATSREHVERAGGILQAFAPAGIGQHRARGDNEAWRTAGAAMQQADAGAPQGEPAQREAGQSASGDMGRPEGTEGMAQSGASRQRADMRMAAHPNQDSLNIQRGDNMGVSEDTYFHAHWFDTYSYAGGTYQEYDPAYRYGASMANSTTYQGSAWEDVEPALREEWLRTYPESRWENFKDAVRTGWERMTG